MVLFRGSVLDCDPSNYWDIFLRHHHHTAMLQEHSRDPRAVRSDIRTRLKLQNKVQRRDVGQDDGETIYYVLGSGVEFIQD